jgi:hypothetical protein
MAKNQSKRLRPAQVEDDKMRAANLQDIEGYAPANQAYTADKVAAAVEAVETAREEEARAEAAAQTARDKTVAAQWELHNKVLGARDQVVAQFGRDSLQAQTMGLVRVSERATPKRPAKKNGGGTK